MLLREAPRPPRRNVRSFAQWLKERAEDGSIDEVYSYDTGNGATTCAGRYVIDHDGDVLVFANAGEAQTYAEIMGGPQEWSGEDIIIRSDERVAGTTVYYAMEQRASARDELIGVALEWEDLMPAIESHREKSGYYGNAWLVDDYSYGWDLITGTYNDETKRVEDWRTLELPTYDRKAS